MSSFNNFNRPPMIGQIQIGDYADIIFNNEQLYRYYIIKLDADGIIIEPMNDFTQTILIQPDINNNYQIVAYEGLHSINFIRNASDSVYIQRDYTQAPIKIIDITDNRGEDNDFTELKNGIILYYNPARQTFDFSDSNNIINTSTNELKAVTFSELGSPLSLTGCEIFNFTNDNEDSRYENSTDENNEIFIHFSLEKETLKLNVNDLTLTVFETNRQFYHIYPLKDKKMLCLLNDDNIYILDTVTKNRININSSIIWRTMKYARPDIKQLSNGDIILVSVLSDTIYPNRICEYYRINIYNGKYHKIASFDHVIKIIAILQDDNFLLWDTEMREIQIWKPLAGLSGQFINIFYVIEVKLTNSLKRVVSELLINGDVLFSFDNIFYLFKYDTQKITKLSSFPFPNLKHILVDIISSIKQLKNGNILINIDGNLKILEFPETNYIKTNYINTVPAIRNYINTNYDELANELNSLKLISD